MSPEVKTTSPYLASISTSSSDSIEILGVILPLKRYVPSSPSILNGSLVSINSLNLAVPDRINFNSSLVYTCVLSTVNVNSLPEATPSYSIIL